jgi:Rod binding domain-containing protein
MSEANAVRSVPALPLERTPARPDRARETASDFEALLIAQMLHSARSAASLTSLDGEESGSSDAVMDLAEQQLSGTLASAGGLGLATLVIEGLDANKAAASAPAATSEAAQREKS